MHIRISKANAEFLRIVATMHGTSEADYVNYLIQQDRYNYEQTSKEDPIEINQGN